VKDVGTYLGGSTPWARKQPYGLLTQIVDMPRMPQASCRDRQMWPVFDAATGDLDAQREALDCCASCPCRNECQSWLATVPPQDRPLGVVARHPGDREPNQSRQGQAVAGCGPAVRHQEPPAPRRRLAVPEPLRRALRRPHPEQSPASPGMACSRRWWAWRSGSSMHRPHPPRRGIACSVWCLRYRATVCNPTPPAWWPACPGWPTWWACTVPWWVVPW